jgi:hypothetical protein
MGSGKKKSLIIKTSARQKSFACSASIACDACDQVKMSLFDRSLSSCTPLIHTPQFFRIGRNALGTAVVVYLFYKTDLSRHLILLFIDYLCSKYIFDYLCSKYISEQHMTTNLKPIHNLIVQHPFDTVLTVAFCLIVCLPLLLYIITKITALIKFFKGK